MSILNKLTEGIVSRDLSREGAAILTKWEKTGLLEGLDDYSQNTMAVLLENQAKELLRESNTMAGGDVEGFAAVAFPIVRRVFGGLLAQKLVSVQPMSLPSGLIFFMDFIKQGPDSRTQGSDYSQDISSSGTDGTAGNVQLRGEEEAQGPVRANAQSSVYGGQVKGRELLTSGVSLDPEARGAHTATPQFQDLIQGFSSARGACTPTAANMDLSYQVNLAAPTDAARLVISFDPDLLARSSGVVHRVRVPASDLQSAVASTHPLRTALGASTTNALRISKPDLRHVTVSGNDGSEMLATELSTATGDAGSAPVLIRRLTDMNADGDLILFFLSDASTGDAVNTELTTALNAQFTIEFSMTDNIDEATDAGNSDTLGALVGASAWEMEGSVDLPEISIKVDSVAVTAVTRKLKASWTPELAQDLNAYHNLDAEVELTGILSEQIALEIDQEILSDLISGAKASTLYWSRRPGLFVTRTTGADATSLAAPPDFTGSVSEWYETLVETINDVSADIHRKTLRGGANFLVCGPEVANILEFTSGFRASVTHDDDTGSVGAVNAGSISKKWDLWVDPYFPRNVILVGRKGSSFLESGYVYAPYVPLQTTPTIFHADDFTPRKAVMTRYGKKLVRPDMYGLVIVRDLEG